jgi:hypothetical protein
VFGPSAGRHDRDHMRRLAAKSAEVRASRVYLTREEATALVDAYLLLRSVARRSKVRNLVARNSDAAHVDTSS